MRCIFPIAPEKLRGNFVILAVDLEFIRQTEDDEIEIGKRICADFFVFKISSDARIADCKSLVMRAVVIKIQSEAFVLISRNFRRRLERDFEFGCFEEQQRFAFFYCAEIGFDYGSFGVEKNLDAIVRAMPRENFIE